MRLKWLLLLLVPLTKFCMGVGVPDVITRANLGDDKFTGF